MAPSGTFTRNTLRQPRPSTMSPPSAGADAAPTMPMAIQLDIARAFIRGLGKEWLSKASESTEMNAAPKPWITRATVKTARLTGSTQTIELTTKSVTPNTKLRLRP
ncbi:Uncharacterised protein [Mycobacterium tuberculosis]|nr:Uncharacterised protein [Mycobacterium tuberculosis]COW09378.1 Uncharacterised protein [Mycobacterium tuberculosis]COW60825.1 Uncharacterised protein [Mycobacterium tuberculosis]COX21869.1 Uncharacterised protein [Mycobacterium tuberculosis]